MLYRLYKPRDFAALYALEEVCFQPPHRFSRGYMRQLIRQENAATWIAEDELRMCGFALVEWRQKRAEIVAYIETLEVLPEARGQGVGGELLRRMEGSASAAGASQIWLHVDEENAVSIRLYERHGYRPMGRQEDYYGRGRAALIYAKRSEDPCADSSRPAGKSARSLTSVKSRLTMSIGNPNLPKSILAFRTYSARMFLHDLLAGLTVGMVALPLAMAFGIASGVTPQAGLYTAVVAGFLISALGGSRTQIGGPTGAFVVIVAGIVARFGLSGLAMVTAMAGLILLLMGLTGLGAAVRFIPRTVVVGFTNGIAILIASTQIKDFFGLRTGAVPSEFLPRVRLLAAHFSSLNPVALGIGIGTLAIILILPRFTRRVPASIIALLVCTGVSVLFHLHIETIGSKFGGIPRGLPPFAWPDFHSEHILPLIPSAFTVALLAALESMLSAVVADGMTGDRHNPNVELVAQGVANMVSPLFGGIPATGAIARTATNIRAGARSPVAGMVHALTLLLILAVAAPLASYIPLATLAAVLFVVAYNMGEWKEIGGIFQLDLAAISVWLVTFALTVFADLTVAVAVGMSLAALLYIYRVADTTTVSPVTDEYIRDGLPHVLQGRILPPYVTLLRIHGPFMWGTTERLVEATLNLEAFEPVVILRLRNMTAIDASGIHAIEKFALRLHDSGRTLLLCGAMQQPSKLLQGARFLDRVGRENIMPNIQAALDRAKEVHAEQPDLRAS